MEDVVRLTQIIDQKQPKSGTTDGVCWVGSGNTMYHVQSLTDKIYGAYSPLIPKQSVNTIWQRHVPLRAQLTIWLAHLEKLKTGDILMGKGIMNPQYALCPFCNSEIESNSHVLFTCRFAWGTWMELLNWWGILGVLHKNCGNFCEEWGSPIKEHNGKKTLESYSSLHDMVTKVYKK